MWDWSTPLLRVNAYVCFKAVYCVAFDCVFIATVTVELVISVRLSSQWIKKLLTAHNTQVVVVLLLHQECIKNRWLVKFETRWNLLPVLEIVICIVHAT